VIRHRQRGRVRIPSTARVEDLLTSRDRCAPFPG
jgi:hypothetical protein